MKKSLALTLKRKPQVGITRTEFSFKPKNAKLDGSLAQLQDIDEQSIFESPLLPDNPIEIVSQDIAQSQSTPLAKTPIQVIPVIIEPLQPPKDISQMAGEKQSRPLLKVYPKKENGQSAGRSFLSAWYADNDWIEYSMERDAVFCFPCRHFAPASYGNADDLFILTGFQNWKKAKGKDGKFTKHIHSQCHKMSVAGSIEYHKNLVANTSIRQMVDAQYMEHVLQNRHYIKTLGEIILLTATQNIAQRGHKETDDISNPGNVLKILKFTAKRDPIIAERLIDGPQNAKYTSATIQNEIIDVFAHMVLDDILECVKSCSYFSIEADEAKDIRKTEQLSLVIRFYDELSYRINECFLEFIPMNKLDAESITDAILSKLDKIGLDYRSSLIGMGFDGASVMSGRVKGVQKRIRDKAPLAYYIHCHGHRLNLVLVASTKAVPESDDFFCILEKLYIFIGNSVVHIRFVELQHEMFPGENIRELQHLSDTRWWCRATSCANALITFPVIMRLLRETAEFDVGARSVDARGLFAQIDIDFLLLLYFFTDILGKVNKVSEFLQRKDVDLGKASKLVRSLCNELLDIQNGDLENRYTENLSKLCKECSISMESKQKRRKKVPFKLADYSTETVGLGYRSEGSPTLNILSPILDCLISEMTRRFSSSSESILQGICALDPTAESFLSEQYLLAFAKFYSINKEDLEHEIPLVKKLIANKKENLTSVLDFLKYLCPYKAAFGCLHKLLLISVTLPVTSATCERTFSKMKLIKTYLRNSMANDRLTNLAILSLEERAENIDLELFVDEFDARHDNRRINLH